MEYELYEEEFFLRS